MAKGISIGVVADTKPYLDGIKSGVIKPTQDAQKALDAVGKTGEQAGDKLETSLKAQQTQTKANEAEYKKLAQVIQQSEQKATQQVGLSTGQRTKLARAGIKQAGAAASQQASAGLSQIGGTISGAISGIGNTVGGILASFGPAGVAIGSAVAVGVGLVTAGVQEQEKALSELRSKFADLYKSAAQDGRDFLDEAQIQSGVYADLYNADDNFAKRRKAQEEALKIGVSLNTYLRAQNGDQNALTEAIKASTRADKVRQEVNGKAGVQRGLDAARVKTAEGDITDKLKAQQQIMQENSNFAKQSTIEARKFAEDAAKARSALATLPSRKTVTIHADTAQLGRDIDKELRKKRYVAPRTPRNGQRYV